MKEILDYKRLSELSKLVKANTATEAEKKELVKILASNNSITQKQYLQYLNDENKDDILKAVMAIGAIVLLGYLISKLLD